jgi:serine/threonine protein kinase
VIVGGGTYDAACDIYSFGVVLSELDTHRVPFADCCDDGPLPEITILGMVGLDGLKPTFSESCPPELLVLAQQCLSFDPRERPSAETIASELRRIRDGFA